MQQNGFAITTRTTVEWNHIMGDHPRKGWSSPDGKLYYHMIPKNASSYIGGILDGWGWKLETDHVDLRGKQGMCVIREPIARWISGITEFFHVIGITPDDVIANWQSYSKIFRYQPTQDGHTAPQVEFLHGYDLDDFDYWMMSEVVTIGNPLHTYLNTRGYENWITNYERQNTVDQDPGKKQIRDFIRETVKTDVDLRSRLKQYYRADYELMEWIGKTKGWK